MTREQFALARTRQHSQRQIDRLAAALDADVRLTADDDLGSVNFETRAA